MQAAAVQSSNYIACLTTPKTWQLSLNVNLVSGANKTQFLISIIRSEKYRQTSTIATPASVIAIGENAIVSLARLSQGAERESGILPYTDLCLTPQEFLRALIGSDDVCGRDV